MNKATDIIIVNLPIEEENLFLNEYLFQTVFLSRDKADYKNRYYVHPENLVVIQKGTNTNTTHIPTLRAILLMVTANTIAP